MTSAVVLNEGSQVLLGAACYPDVGLCVPAEGCGVLWICCVRSHLVTASKDLKYDINLSCLCNLVNMKTNGRKSDKTFKFLQP